MKKKLVYISTPYFLDYDISLIKHLSEFVDVYFMLEINPLSKKATILNISNYKNETFLYKGFYYKELYNFSNYLNEEKTYIINNKQSKSLFFNVKAQYKIYKTIKNINPDYIHFNKLALTDYILLITKFRKKIIQTYHDPIPHSSDLSIRNYFKRFLNTKFILTFLILNKQQQNDFIKRHKLRQKKVFLSNLGVYEYLKARHPSSKINPENYILFFGRISEYKGVEYLIEAFNKLSDKYPDEKLVIAGSGKIYFNIENLNKNITIINKYIEEKDLASYIYNSKFIVCPYTDATQSGVLMTAFAFNKPIIASNVGGISDYIHDRVNGLLFKSKDSEDLLNKMNELINNKPLYNKICNTIYLDCNSGDFSWRKIAINLCKTYNQIQQ